MQDKASVEMIRFMKTVADKESTKIALISFQRRFLLLAERIKQFREQQTTMREAILEQLTAALKGYLEGLKAGKSKKHKDTKSKELKKKMQLHLDNNTIEPLAKMLQILHNARRKLIFRTLRLMAI